MSLVVAPRFCSPDTYNFSHNPYDMERSRLVSFDSAVPAIAPLPEGTLHHMLHRHVTFVPYPTEALEVSEPTADELQYMTVKAFVGQLPFNATHMQLAWICQLLGCRVVNPQRIMKTQGGVRQPTGGVHVFCDAATLEVLQQNMHKRVLIDDTGVWFASTAAQKAALDSYVAYLHANRIRAMGRPHNSVVVQPAVSTYQPPHRVAFDAAVQ